MGLYGTLLDQITFFLFLSFFFTLSQAVTLPVYWQDTSSDHFWVLEHDCNHAAAIWQISTSMLKYHCSSDIPPSMYLGEHTVHTLRIYDAWTRWIFDSSLSGTALVVKLQRRFQSKLVSSLFHLIAPPYLEHHRTCTWVACFELQDTETTTCNFWILGPHTALQAPTSNHMTEIKILMRYA